MTSLSSEKIKFNEELLLADRAVYESAISSAFAARGKWWPCALSGGNELVAVIDGANGSIFEAVIRYDEKSGQPTDVRYFDAVSGYLDEAVLIEGCETVDEAKAEIEMAIAEDSQL